MVHTRYVKNNFKNRLIFLFIVLTLGFIFGTFTLGLFVKSVVISIRQTGWLANHEMLVVIVIIIVYLTITLLFARWITRWLTVTKDITTASLFFILLTFLVYLSVHYWLMPAKSPFIKPLLSIDHRFLGGPYPNTELLNKLKAQGYTTVISVLDPLVLPDEAYLLNKEKKEVDAMGMKLIQIPLIPGNVESLKANQQIKAAAMSNNDAKFYVHGNNDQQRLETFMEVVNQYKRSAKDIQTIVIMHRYPTINLSRGMAIQLDQHVIIAPKPTTEELMRFFLNTPNEIVKLPIRTIISMNPDDVNTQENDVKTLLNSHGIQYLVIPVPLYPYDSQSILKIVNQIRRFSDGILIYSYYMPPQSETMSAFIMSYLTNLPALPSALFINLKMQAGPVKVIAPNVAIGPQPTATEFNDYLKPRGIRNIGFAGPCSGIEYNKNMNLAAMANLKWTCLEVNDNYQVLTHGGPWYVYGPALQNKRIRNELTQRLGVAMPDQVLLGE